MKAKDDSPNKISRRAVLQLFGGALLLPQFFKGEMFAADFNNPNDGWTAEWDKAVLEAATKRLGKDFDANAGLLQVKLGSQYRVHSNLRDTIAHPTRESLEYAALLLESGKPESISRAAGILEKVVAMQNADANSKFYGLWGYYSEESVEKMPLADFNWADFNGAWLLTIDYLHRDKLPEKLRTSSRESIARAAESVKRRDVSPYYTNIAVQGSFVTICAAELLNDKSLFDYALKRFQNLARAIDETGSFAEYNSPTYNWVVIENLTRIKMFAKNAEVLALNERLRRRIWEHLAAHWHQPTWQFAAPMSRSYGMDLGAQLWLQKALGNAVRITSLDDIKAVKIPAQSGGAAMLDYKCPADLQTKFTKFAGANQHREVYISGAKLIDNAAVSVEERKKTVRPVQGTSYLTGNYALGSANRSDFWVQRRPLALHWGDQTRPARYLQLKLMKDDYDFASGLFYSVQNENSVLAAISFRSPGGDKHPTVAPVINGEIEASRIYAQFLFNNLRKDAPVLVSGEPLAKLTTLPKLDETRIAFETETCRFIIEPRIAEFGKNTPVLRFAPVGKEQFALEIDVFGRREKRKTTWAEVGTALIAFTLTVDALDKDANLAAFDARIAKQKFEKKADKDRARFVWQTASGKLELAAGRRIQTVEAQDALFEEKINGADVPIVRLSDEKLIAVNKI